MASPVESACLAAEPRFGLVRGAPGHVTSPAASATPAKNAVTGAGRVLARDGTPLEARSNYLEDDAAAKAPSDPDAIDT